VKGALVLLAVVVLAVPSAAQARTIELGWREHDGIGVMSFSVSTLTLGNDEWTIRGSFTNHSNVALRIDRRFFALGVFATSDLSRPAALIRATSFSPVPIRIGPGKTWRGRFGGPGVPSRGSYLRVRFGRFIGRPSPIRDFPNGFSWLTDHVHRLR
jgi:hypothetical protein